MKRQDSRTILCRMSKNRKQGLTLVCALLKMSIVLTDFQQYQCVFCLFGGSTRWHFRVIDCDILGIFLLEYILSRHGLFNRKGLWGSSLIFPLSRAVLYNFIDFGNFLRISSSLLCYKKFPELQIKVDDIVCFAEQSGLQMNYDVTA